MTTRALPGYKPQSFDEPWGVWDQHEHRWVVAPELSGREVWIALLETNSPHPWELEMRQAHPATEKPALVCKDCDGDGTCWSCDQQCPACLGEGVLSE